HGRTPSIGFMRPFGCPVTILNTLDPLGKFERKVDEGFLVGYSVNSKSFRVFNSRTRIVQETLHVNFLKNKPNITGTGPTWLFDIDSLTRTMNYQPVTAGNQSNPTAGDAAFNDKEHDAEKPESAVNLSLSSSALSGEQDDMTKKKDKGKSHVEYFTGNRDLYADSEDYSEDSNNNVSAAGPIVPTAGQNYANSINPISVAGPSNTNTSPTHGKSSLQDASQPLEMLEREDFIYSDHENVGAEADFNNLETSITFSHIPTTRTHKDHPLAQIIGDLSSTTQTRSMTRVIKDQGHTQEEGIDYEEVFAPVARIEAIRLFLAYASFMGFMVYQMDVKSAFLYGNIEEEVYVCQPPGFEDPDHPDKVYKVVNALYGLHQAPRAWYETLANYLLKNGFHRGQIDKTLFIKKQKGDILLVHIYVKQKEDEIFISQDKYVAEILKKFGLTEGKSAITPIDTEKPLLKDPDGEDVDVHIYRSMIVAYSDSDYAGASLDKKSTTGGCQFLGCSLISWLQALVDKKKVVVTEAAIRDALHLDDAEGVDCLPNEEIFTALAHMGYEKPSTKLTFCRKFNFSKYIFDSLVRNVDSSSKFYMYPRFIHLIIQNQLGVETPLFEGMFVAREPEEQGDAEEQGNDDNAAEEPITAIDDEALDTCAALARRVEHLEHDKVAQNLEIIKLKTRVKKLERANKVKTLKLRRLRKVGTSQRVDTLDDTIMVDMSNQGRMIEELDKDEGAVLMNEKEETKEVKDITGDAHVEGRQAEIYQIDMDHAAKVLSMQEDELEIQEAVEVVTTAKLITEVVAVVSETVNATAVVPTEESSAKTPSETKSKDKGKGVMVEEPKPMKKKQQVKLDEAYARKLQEELNQHIDWEIAVDHVKQKAKENPYVQRYQVMKKRPQTEAQARRNMMMYLKDTTGFRLDYFKGMSYDDIRPIFEAKFNSNIEFLLKSKEQMEEEENRAIASINETPAHKAAKRRRLNEEAEDVEELK
nr:hypothetical protein [Tanacetum cinerariifolium]